MEGKGLSDVDESLIVRIAGLSRGGQRWLKTAIQAIVTSEVVLENQEEEPKSRRRAKAPALEPPAREPASLEDVITGKADLREHLEDYPELQEELDGLADVIDLLREAGDARRKRGEQILREEILGERPQDEEGPEDEGRGRKRR